MSGASKTIMILAGGTGGHIMPALAVARELDEHGYIVLWIGTREGLEARIVTRHGYKIKWIRARGLRGKGVINALFAFTDLIWSCLQIIVYIYKYKPDAVLGMGGYVSAAGGVAAWITKRRLLIHEQNTIAGLANRVLAKLAWRVMEAFPNTFPASYQAVCTGNPVRKEISEIEKPEQRMAGRSNQLFLLVLGGSQGAQTLNQVVPEAVSQVKRICNTTIRHQAGNGNTDETVASYRSAGVTADVVDFIEDMPASYKWADLIICRAGAMTIAELCAAGCAAILVPYQHAVDDHQTSNAHYLADHGAGIIIPESEFTAGKLAEYLNQICTNTDDLITTAKAARSLAKPDAASHIASLCMGVAA